ncbi:MAG: ABC transporter permease [Natronomonas sp.]|jgi:simple sugar transport system permease protein|uniref:ABC transporter permease n=1 Tax=Natronomonas sp. TaxID=2184060 RepID=UPI0028707D0D|nr:ABC transporter permease [Natronomonas sp.]MDR9381199.1 ABC transporter permease [Natronomonas sp.]MDR9429962.1 ABC transporter permease [Natronomonas sp.]
MSVLGRTTLKWGLLVVAAIAALFVGQFLAPAGSVTEQVFDALLTTSYASAVLRVSVPIGFAALGGIFAEKSGVINIGIEGFLVLSALSSVVAFHGLAEAGVGTTAALWTAFLAGILVSVAAAAVFAVFVIRYEADQVIAGLAIWLISLGVAPFVSLVLFESVNSPSVETFGTWRIPLLADIPGIGPVLFDASPMVYLLLVATPVSWYVLRHTRLGRRIRASGENPRALDTAGVSVTRTRYVGVLLSGVLCGIGGAGFTLGQLGRFVGAGQTSIDGRGFLGIVAYLFGNYNPITSLGGALLFASFDSLQLRLQQISELDVPSALFGVLPFIVVIVVLTLIGGTRLPAALGQHYDDEE